MSKQKGFTLIELMIVIAIVAILVALAVPAYQDYTIRTKIGECVNNAAVPKLQVSEYRETVGDMPANSNEAGILGSGDSQFCDGFVNYQYLNSNQAVFYIEVNEAAIDSVLPSDGVEPRMLGSVNTSGGVDWACQRGSTSPAELKYLPSTCRADNTN